MDKYLNETLTEQISLYCFDISILKHITKSVFLHKEKYLTSTTIGNKYRTEESTYYFEEYVPAYRKNASNDQLIAYEWEFNEEISFEKTQIFDLPERRRFLRSIPFGEFTEMEFCIHYEGSWHGVALTSKTLILF